MGSSPDKRPPSVDKIARALPNELPHRTRVQAARQAIDNMASPNFEDIVNAATQVAASLAGPNLRPVINMSGIILHTGLGRAPLARQAIHAIARCGSHQNLEFDLDSGERGERQSHVRKKLCELTGAEGALVVNNCAAATWLVLHSLCSGRDVLLSRGQMVEIGGSFRLPDIIRSSGCNLREVGCTNKTRISDYKDALSQETAAILICHPSNYKIIGFTAQPAHSDLADLAHTQNALLINDLGHGCLIDTARLGLPKEQTIGEAVACGADIVLSSGDKLMGGPQAGIIVGNKDLVEKCSRHPLARCVRIDKLSLAALEATLDLYLDQRVDEVPVWSAVMRPLGQVESDAQALATVKGSVVEPGLTEIGGGSFPGEGVKTWRVGLRAKRPNSLLDWLRGQDPPIVGRIEGGLVWLDPRTCSPEELSIVATILSTAPSDL
ncbi:MAG: L-seryl-tRNA(Sec) selenium transferase [Chthonomonadaceae bacterium]|nr:L-seryl-tRNA(Sec) selenium transferase [Chthonomonadaceae bacterium]